MRRIEGDLSFEGFEGIHFQFVAQTLDEADFHAFAVEVAGVIEEVDFELTLRNTVVLNSRAETEIGDAGKTLAIDGGFDRIHPDGGKLLGFQSEVGGGEAQFSSQLAALDNGAVNGVVAAEEAGSRGEVATFDGKTDPGAADGFFGDDHGGDAVNLETQGLAKGRQGLKIAAAAFAEGPIVADRDAAQRLGCPGKRPNEGIRREGGEGTVKRDDEQVGDSKLRQDQAFVQGGGQEARGGVRAQELHGVRIECGDNRSAPIRFGGSLGAPDNFLVAAMHSIEEPDRKMHRAGQGGEVGDGLQSLHDGESVGGEEWEAGKSWHPLLTFLPLAEVGCVVC